MSLAVSSENFGNRIEGSDEADGGSQLAECSVGDVLSEQRTGSVICQTEAAATRNTGEVTADAAEVDRVHREADLDLSAELVDELRADRSLVRAHRVGALRLKKERACFSGNELVEWLVKKKDKSRDEAIEIGKQLFSALFLRPASSNVESFEGSLHGLWRLVEDESARALNSQYACKMVPRPAADVGCSQENLIATLFEEFLTQNGQALDYNAVADSPHFKAFLSTTGEMKRINLSALTEKQYLTFFINLYNMAVIHAMIIVGAPRSTWQRFKFFNAVRYTVGGYTFSLQDIENGILRGNRVGVGALSPQFRPGDPRMKLAMKEFDRRIHFALVCGAKSCPRLRAYSANNIDHELKVATREFLDGEACQVNPKKKQVSLSRILSWYSADFGSSKTERLQWIANQMTDGEKKEDLQRLIAGGSVKVCYHHYDWSLNTSNI